MRDFFSRGLSWARNDEKVVALCRSLHQSTSVYLKKERKVHEHLSSFFRQREKEINSNKKADIPALARSFAWYNVHVQRVCMLALFCIEERLCLEELCISSASARQQQEVLQKKKKRY